MSANIRIEDPETNQTQIARRSDGLIESITNSRGATTFYSYRLDNRLESLTVEGESWEDWEPRTTLFDYDANGNLTSVVDAAGNEISYEYDAADRLVKIVDAKGEELSFTYEDGLLTMVTAPDNQGSGGNPRRTRLSYDHAGRVILVEAETSLDVFEKRVGYGYDGFSQLKELSRLQDMTSKSFTYSYDALGRLTSVADFLQRTTQFDYAPYCLENTVTSPRGIQQRRSLDSLCRLTRLETQDLNSSPGVMETIQNRYDEMGRLIQTLQGNAQYHEATEPEQEGRYGQSRFGSSTRYQYDRASRLVSLQQNGVETSYEYDSDGNLLKLRYPSGKYIDYFYHSDGRLQSANYYFGVGAAEFVYHYDEAGRLFSIETNSGQNDLSIVSFRQVHLALAGGKR